LKVEAAAGEEPAAKSIKEAKTAKVAATQDEPVKSRRVGGKQATTENQEVVNTVVETTDATPVV